MFDYLDRYYLKNGAERCLNLTETALSQFKEKIFKPRINELRSAILEEIQRDRENEIVDKELIKEAVWQFIYMGFEKKTMIKKIDGGGGFTWMGEKNLLIYDQDFENHLRQSTTEFYRKKAV